MAGFRAERRKPARSSPAAARALGTKKGWPSTEHPGRTWLRLTYQRHLSDGSYLNVLNTGSGAQHPVTVVVR